MSVAGALRVGRAVDAPNRLIGRLFMVGSFCFAIASVPAAADVSGRLVGAVYFIGSIFFTAAAAEQYRSVAADDSLDFVASGVQLAGTIFFNISTFAALDERLDGQSVDRLVWSPDVFGSICFLVASAVAIVAVRRTRLAGQLDRKARRIAVLNMVGSIFFGISAVAAFVVPKTADTLDASLATSGTLAGAICFLVAAYWLVPREPR